MLGCQVRASSSDMVTKLAMIRISPTLAQCAAAPLTEMILEPRSAAIA